MENKYCVGLGRRFGLVRVELEYRHSQNGQGGARYLDSMIA